MDWLSAPELWLNRLLLQRAIAAIYLIAFISTWNQFPALLGERGLLPVPRYLELVRPVSLFRWGYTDRRLRVVVGTGIVLSALGVLGVTERLPFWAGVAVWLAMWGLYLSVVNVGQTFYAFGWESLLLEAGFLAAWLGPAAVAPALPTLWWFRWLLFRVELGAGLIKIRGDRCWRELTCLDYHHETQPMPGPLSWYFHHLPRPLHRVEVVANHLTQLVLPWGLLCPQPGPTISGLAVVATQGWLILSGNFSWLNWLTLSLAFSAIDPAWLHRVVPLDPPPLAPVGVDAGVAVLLVSALVVVLSWWPVRNLASRRQLMNYAFNRFHLINTYGAFGTVTRVRYELIVEGTDADRLGPDTVWREYEFKGKPGDVRRRPPQVAPYHLRLDWLMWFAAMAPPDAHPWVLALVVRLLEADRGTLRLLRRDPFAGHPPRYVRVRWYRYRYTTWAERRRTGAYWHRELIGEYLPPVTLRAAETAGDLARP